MSADTLHVHQIESAGGAIAEVLSFGATLSALRPRIQGDERAAILSYSDLSCYQNDRNYLGVTVGRYANRIANGRMSL